MRKLITCAAAVTMVAGSSMAHAAPAAINDVRTGSDVTTAEGIDGTTIWMGLLAAGLLIFVLFQINDDEDADLPASP